MIIAGGVYVEDCVTPRTTQLLGSAGRATVALSKMRSDLELHTYHPPELWEDVRVNFAPVCTKCQLYSSNSRVHFSYLFPLGRPLQTPYLDPSDERHFVTGEQAIIFGCVEGDFVVRANVVVADLQGSTSKGFRAAGSHAEKLAIVLNGREVMSRTGKPTITEAANELLEIEKAEVVVVKDGPNGSCVFTRTAYPAPVPAYSSKSLYKIGSGDIFSAVFAHFWMEGAAPVAAADLASRHTAAYVESPSLPLTKELPVQTAREPKIVDQIILVGGQNSIKDQWFMELLSEAISHLGKFDIRLVETNTLGHQLREASERNHSVSVLCIAGDKTEAHSMLMDPIISMTDPVIFLDNSYEQAGIEVPKGRVFADLSQAIYELFWMPI